VVQALPSSQAAPFAFGVWTHRPVSGLQAAVWHWSLGVQTFGVPPTQPPWPSQAPPSMQRFGFSQGVPDGAGRLEHCPVSGSHVPATWHWDCGWQVTAVPGVQVPAWQVSVSVQALSSLQGVPSAFGGSEHCPVAGSHVPALWHASEAVQTTGLLPTQVPFWQVSVRVQAFPSLQGVPFAFGGLEQSPVCGLHVPASWHWSEAAQVFGVPAQTPLVQMSSTVQGLPSSQAVPFGFVGLVQTPEVGSQTPAKWHWDCGWHTTVVPGVHCPPWQVSVSVQAFPSPQLVPFGFAGLEQVPVAGSQTPTSWHWSEAEQTTGLPPTHSPFWQVSVRVQALPSLQAEPFGLSGLEQAPVAGSQTPATWHWSSAWQTTGVPGVQTPPWHVSPWVQAFPSSHGVPFGWLVQGPIASHLVPTRTVPCGQGHLFCLKGSGLSVSQGP
jgi:hypothetical protein